MAKRSSPCQIQRTRSGSPKIKSSSATSSPRSPRRSSAKSLVTTSAKDLWAANQELHASQSRARIMATRMALALVTKGASTVAEFFVKINGLAYYMASVGHRLKDEELVMFILTSSVNSLNQLSLSSPPVFSQSPSMSYMLSLLRLSGANRSMVVDIHCLRISPPRVAVGVDLPSPASSSATTTVRGLWGLSSWRQRPWQWRSWQWQ